jgi:hypothetical protein
MENKNDDDLKKALAFLLEKEMKPYSIEKKKEFLLKKVSPEIVEKAMELYPVIESNISNQIEDYKKTNKKGFLDSFFDFGVISSVLLATLGINYLIDLNRNKKNDLFYKEIEKKINDELKTNTDNMNNELKQSLSNYVVKDNLNSEIHSQVQTYAQEKGLSLNLSSKSMKENITKLNNDMASLDKKVKELSVKIDNNNLLFKQDIMKEFSKIIEENNKMLFGNIIEEQRNTIKTILELPRKEVINTEPIKSVEAGRIETNSIPLTKTESNVPNEIQIMPQEEVVSNDFTSLLNRILGMLKDDSARNTFIKQLTVFSV